METQEKIKKEANQKGLDVIFVTEGMNGYPVPEIGYGVIGFENYEECIEFAKEHDADEICLLFKRDGWHHYQILGSVTDAIDLISDKMRNDVVYQAAEDAIEYINAYFSEKINEIKKELADADEFDVEAINLEINDLVKSRDSLIYDIEKIDFENEFITIDLSRGERFAIESFPKKTMSHWEDSKSYVVGCFFSY